MGDGSERSGVTVAVIDSGLFGVNFGEKHEDVDLSKVVKQYNFIDDNLQVIDEKDTAPLFQGRYLQKPITARALRGLCPGLR